ncbi:cation diffusion facilitator family transporter [Halarsenatibacter silvermanii]|uniref:Cation diffusion facilitator family transporter n=1 Tax=Halarsenatibacter silvermanii TaxID=321763 RepID=A0A1G9GZ82_9FIRM|nr:cation diffusion facilitator family transporter [Halarsenatibacter silvermanii]SDL05593.1 cation diffusion facilitator family transporter [Halarsenatibacter silvermanii]
MNKAARSSESKKVIMVTLAGNILLAAVKITLGIIAASAALVADGFHSLSDITTTLGVLISLYISQQPPDENHHYGHRQAEPLAATGIGIFLLIIALLLGRNMILRVIESRLTFPTNIALAGVGISILVKEFLYRYVIRIARRTQNAALEADAWHHRSDVASSLAAGIGIIGARLGFPLLDPIAGLVVSLLILRVALQLLCRAMVQLLGRGPAPEKLAAIEETIAEVEGVVEVMEIKGLYHGPELYLDVKLTVPRDIRVDLGHEISAVVRERVEAIYQEAEEVLIHVEPAEITVGEIKEDLKEVENRLE